MAQAAVMERTATYTNLAPEARCLYDIYKKEGDVFYCRRKYKKALLSYNEALRLANHSAQTLVARSRCYMGIGMLAKALDDTEAALSISNTYLPVGSYSRTNRPFKKHCGDMVYKLCFSKC
ncbi:tetratricopeptide repeat protein 25-like [Elysia marginata]|uniref:Outer dynein arm-docking complex subunit 4 n=1 Tax=Elysia marginata TaxID=1093978 RepID=A0AAV4JH79_9GAST|nr:tetratricopeptide repeat protein 25-like [Elysia marginata]